MSSKNIRDYVRSVVRDPRLNPGDRHVLHCMAMLYTNRESGLAWPKLATLADDTGLAPRTIRNHLHRLVDLGILVAERKQGHPTVYRMPIAPIETGREVIHTPATGGPTNERLPRPLVATTPATGGHYPGHWWPPEQSYERKREQRDDDTFGDVLDAGLLASANHSEIPRWVIERWPDVMPNARPIEDAG